jgi:hypothetical protein
MSISTIKNITAEELEKKFDNGEDVSEYFDTEKAKASLRVMLPALLCKQIIEISKKENISIDDLVAKLLLEGLQNRKTE